MYGSHRVSLESRQSRQIEIEMFTKSNYRVTKYTVLRMSR